MWDRCVCVRVRTCTFCFGLLVCFNFPHYDFHRVWRSDLFISYMSSYGSRGRREGTRLRHVCELVRPLNPLWPGLALRAAIGTLRSAEAWGLWNCVSGCPLYPVPPPHCSTHSLWKTSVACWLDQWLIDTSALVLRPLRDRNNWDPVDHGWEQLVEAWAWRGYLLPTAVAFTTEPVWYYVGAEVGTSPYKQWACGASRDWIPDVGLYSTSRCFSLLELVLCLSLWAPGGF